MKKTTLSHNTKRNKKESALLTIQSINTVLDFIIKAGAVSIIPGAFIVFHYLNSIGFKHFFGTAMGLQGGLIAVIISFGLLFLFTICVLAFNPWVTWRTRLAISDPKAKNYFSFIFLLKLNICFQLTLLWLILLNAKNYFFWATIICLPLVAAWGGGIRNVACLGKLKYAGGMIVALTISVIPWLILIPIIETIPLEELPAEFITPTQYIFLIVWILIYSLINSWLLFSVSENQPNGERQILKKSFLTFGFILTIVFVISPKFFASAAMYATTIRAVPQESKWYLIDKGVFQKLIPVRNPLANRIKEQNGNLYFCGYSPFSVADRFILCPSDIAGANPDQCPIFTISEARPIPKPPSKDWACPSK